MTQMQRSRTLLWLFCFAAFLAPGCAGTSSTTTPSAATSTAVASAIGNPSTEGQSATLSKVTQECPLCGLWRGQWEYNSKSPNRGVQLEIYQESPGQLLILYTVENGNPRWEQLNGKGTPRVTPPWPDYGTSQRKAKMENDEDGNIVFYFGKGATGYTKYTLREEIIEAVGMEGRMKTKLQRIQR